MTLLWCSSKFSQLYKISLCNIINIQLFLVEWWNIYYINKYISDLHWLQLIVSRSLANYQYSSLPHRRTIHIAHKVGIIPEAKGRVKYSLPRVQYVLIFQGRVKYLFYYIG